MEVSYINQPNYVVISINEQIIREKQYLVPWMGFNLWKFKLCVIRIHAFNFFSSWSTQNLHENIGTSEGTE